MDKMQELNLTPAIREIEKMIEKLKLQHMKKLSSYEKSLKHLLEINTAYG
jgi:hypothetical protein